MIDKVAGVAGHDKTPLIISAIAMCVSLLSLLVTIIVLIDNAELRGRYAEQSAHSQIQDIQAITTQAYINSLRLLMNKAGIQSPDPPKFPSELITTDEHSKRERQR